jgi:hypothetical protein
VNVGRNISYEAGSGWCKVSVSLGWRDLLDLVGEGKVVGYVVASDPGVQGGPFVVRAGSQERIPVALAYRVLQAYCDVLAWAQLASEGGASREYAQGKIRECIARTGSVLKV